MDIVKATVGEYQHIVTALGMSGKVFNDSANSW
jgi:hypothetical protein